ncbi:hypothetical protein HYT52_00610 [Candidatus Woesearchaeota archaeon]|nr:hypothetical protein [Candidatus Woesearchaeota archaeon]
MSCILWDITEKNYSGMLVLDPHDEYYGRTGLGLKDHPHKERISYYTPNKLFLGRAFIPILLPL